MKGYNEYLGEMARRGPKVEHILTDLIAEMRERHRPTPSGYLCEDCTEDYRWPCPMAQAADRAEARLKGLTDE